MDSSDDAAEEENDTQKFIPFFCLSSILFLFISCTGHTGPQQPLLSILIPVKKETPAAEEKPLQKKEKKTIYITFDDGPNKGTKNVLQTLKEEQVPVSMFIIGQHVYGSREQKADWESIIKNAQIEICNHSYTHAQNRFNKFYRNDSVVIKDFERCKDSLKLRNNLARTPGRNIWRLPAISVTDNKKTIEAADALYQKGFYLIGWDLEWRFTNKLELKQTPAQLLTEVDSAFAKNRTRIPGHLVLLTHDQAFADSANRQALKSFITQLKQSNQYQLAFISRYPGLKKP
jgi:peptidoglycan/xylan/chitin deacetylase (PgdA/CDA1 family)